MDTSRQQPKTKAVTVTIFSVAEGELPEDGERVIAMNRSRQIHTACPGVYWNKRKNKFTHMHNAPVGAEVAFWFREKDLIGD